MPFFCFSPNPVYFCFLDSSCSSNVVCPQNPFEAPEITKGDESEANEEGVFIDVEASDDVDICVN